MAAPESGPEFDPDTVHAKYLAERDKRLVPGRAAIRDLARDAHFAHFLSDPFTPPIQRAPLSDEVDVVIVGGGIAGILAGVQLRNAGIERIRIIDKAGGIGGTWYWNRYPGVMCDVESSIYLPLLEELGYVPRDRYASGEEIRLHLQAIATRFDLEADALFHTGVERAEWDESVARWHVESDRGDRITARYYVLAVGILNLMKLPAIPGMENFAGRAFHTARWDYEFTGGAPGRPLTKLTDKVVGLVGTGATGIQCLPPLAQAAKHVYVFQRTPSAVGVRGNRRTDASFADQLQPGWQRARMDNFEAIMNGRPVDADLIDDGWTHHYAAVQNVPRRQGESRADYLLRAEETDFRIMEEHRRRVEELVQDQVTAENLKPYYRYLCKRPCFHDEFLDAFNEPNVTLVHTPAGIDRVTARGPVVGGQQYDLDCLVYGTGFEAELTPLQRRVGHHVIGRDGVRLAEKWADGAASLFGMMTRGFPNMFVMPAPGQQAVVTVNYTRLADFGAQFLGRTVALLEQRAVRAFDVSAQAEASWLEKIVSSYVDASHVMAACTPSRLNNEGNPQAMNPRNGNYGRGRGDFFAYCELLEQWLAAGDCDGLELDVAAVPR